MKVMSVSGWKQLFEGQPWFQGKDAYPITAYSEFIPPPRLAVKPCGSIEHGLFSEDNPYGWNVTEYEERLELRPGLEHIAGHLIKVFMRLGNGKGSHGISRNKLKDNPYWPEELAAHAGKLKHERYPIIAPLALSKTQDDKGRVRWTLFGGSEHGPGRPFWKSFYERPEVEIPRARSLKIIRHLLRRIYAVPEKKLARLHAAGFRVLPEKGDILPGAGKDALPAWTTPYLLDTSAPVQSVKYLLTFMPFAHLPEPIRQAYMSGKMHLIPFPGSLVFWGAQSYRKMQKELPLATQIPLLQVIERHESPAGIRVPQSGWMHERKKNGPAMHHGPVRNSFRRTDRWDRVHRDEDDLELEETDDNLLHVIFSTHPDDLGLYGKPMARNVQIWNEDYELLLDGPGAGAKDIKRAEDRILRGGQFGYRFIYPAMRVGTHEIYWHRPLVAFLSSRTRKAEVIEDSVLGYLTAYETRTPRPDSKETLSLWPVVLKRGTHDETVDIFQHAKDPRPHQTALNIRKLLELKEFFKGRPVPRSVARRMLTLPRSQTLEGWLASLPQKAASPARGKKLARELEKMLEPITATAKRESAFNSYFTYGETSKRAFEERYWKTIAHLSEGTYKNKENADCVRDEVTLSMLAHQRRDLEELGDYLLRYYAEKIADAGLQGKALAGDLPFSWRTDFDMSWSDGWLRNQRHSYEERNLIVVIPGRDRSKAVIMADHYDTAYMEDHYEKENGGNGARLAACGADDNHSATSALMLGAPIFLALSRQGKLACDIWLVHLTGEEFPSDCMGARDLSQHLVQKTLKMRLPSGAWHDLSQVRVKGIYVSDMIAHNNDHRRNIFQIAPGVGRESMWLAWQAHIAAETWNRQVEKWNADPLRRKARPYKRSPDGSAIPAIARHPTLSGELRPPFDPRSTLYNTDGQIFSDCGIPAVLFMENYDINRTGYHDSHDTMMNIDLDYGSAVAAIVIESVVRAATQDGVR
jgi:hypothetical protein